MPRFNGENLKEWLLKKDQYCNNHNLTDGHHLCIPSMHIDNPTLSWYRETQPQKHLTICTTFRIDIIKR